jgi:glutamine amidotransferase
MIHPIVDEFWSPNPSHERSTQFAQTKGQTTTNENKEVIMNNTTAGSNGPDADALRMKVAALTAH